MKTFSAKPAEIKREWFVVDATDKVLGRVATEIALRLRGKHKPEYTPHVDTGDHIVVINAEKIAVTGNKEEGKIYYRHTGYPGGIKDVNVRQLRERAPERIIENAVRGMMPKNPLGALCLKNYTSTLALSTSTKLKNLKLSKFRRIEWQLQKFI